MEKSFLELLEGYERGELSKTEMQQFFAMLEQEENRAMLASVIDEKVEDEDFIYSNKPEQVGKAWESLKLLIEPDSTAVVKGNFIKKYWWLAACIVAAIGLAVYMPVNKVLKDERKIVKKSADVAPGKDGAILQLSDGSEIILDSQANGLLTMQNGAALTLNDGQLTYSAAKTAGDIGNNIISTPKGRQYKLVLPDGTNIWLNASSSVKFPTAFAGTQRRIEITGEVYLEVAKDERKPFVVSVDKVYTIEVLGTSFNINAYINESLVRTTLLEGKVKLKDEMNNTCVLLPAQEASVRRFAGQMEKIKISKHIDTAKAVAWKNAVFDFEEVSLQELMRQVERWYSVEVVYEDAIPDIHFFGKVSRNISLEGLLKGLKGAEVKFRLEGNKLIVGR